MILTALLLLHINLPKELPFLSLTSKCDSFFPTSLEIQTFTLKSSLLTSSDYVSPSWKTCLFLECITTATTTTAITTLNNNDKTITYCTLTMNLAL